MYCTASALSNLGTIVFKYTSAVVNLLQGIKGVMPTNKSTPVASSGNETDKLIRPEPSPLALMYAIFVNLLQRTTGVMRSNKSMPVALGRNETVQA